jgi:hypothetical protein
MRQIRKRKKQELALKEHDDERNSTKKQNSLINSKPKLEKEKSRTSA